MARVHYWQYLINEEGQPIQGADIYLYLAGTTTAAYIYDRESGGSAYRTYPDSSRILRTNVEGYFEFWIGGPTETSGYSYEQKFKIEWKKIGVVNSTIDNIDVFPLSEEVDETDTNTSKNKLVSNYLAKKWTDKANEDALAIHHGSIVTLAWTPSAGMFYYDLTHNLGITYPLFQMYNTNTSTLTAPTSAITLDSNTIRIWMNSNDPMETVTAG